MVINDIKDLSKVIDLARKKGVDSIKIDNIEIKLGRLEPKLSKRELTAPVQSEPQISDEDLLYWSADRSEAI